MNFIVGNFEYRILSVSTVSIIKYNGSDTGVNIPSTVYNSVYGVVATIISIDKEVFMNKTFINSITFNEPCYIESFGDDCFSQTNITDFVMPNSVKTINARCFRMCMLLTDVTLSTNLTNIVYSTFQETSLSSILIPPSVTNIGDFAFLNTSLSSVIIPSSVTNIARRVFDSLDNVIIEDPSISNVYYEPEQPWGLAQYSFGSGSGTITFYNTAGYNNLSDNWKQNALLFSTIIYHSEPYPSQQSPTITNFSVPTKPYGSAPFEISPPTSDSSGAFSYTSSDLSVATVSGSTITIVGKGSTEITATQGETADYTSGTISATFQVTESTATNPVIINSGEELLYFMNTTSTYANIVNSLELNNNLIGSSYKVLSSGNDVKLTKLV